MTASIHGVAFLIGETGLLVIGASGAGKSSLVLAVAAGWREDPVRLVADDRVRLARAGGRLLARPVAGFEGRIEVRGMGMAKVSAMPSAVMRGIVALGPDEPPRMPAEDVEKQVISDVSLPILRIRSGPETAASFLTKWPHFRAFIRGRG